MNVIEKSLMKQAPALQWQRQNKDPILKLVYICSMCFEYLQTSNISHTLGSKIVDHPDVVGASPVSTAPTTSSFLI